MMHPREERYRERTLQALLCVLGCLGKELGDSRKLEHGLEAGLSYENQKVHILLKVIEGSGLACSA